MSETGGGARNRRLLAGILVVSLAFNLFVAGFLFARWLRPIPERSGWPMAGVMRGFERLPAAKREQLRRLTRAHRQTLREKITRLRQARTEAARRLEADPFDPRALEQTLARIRTLSGEVQREVQDMLLVAAEALPPDARRGLARRYGLRPGRHHRPR